MKTVHDHKTKHNVGRGSVEDYLQFHREMISAGDLDPYYPLLKRYADDKGHSDVERIRLALFFAMTYSAPSAIVLSDMTDRGVVFNDEWWNEHKFKMVFGPDRMRVKSNDMFLPAMSDWRRLEATTNLVDLFTQTNLPEINYSRACTMMENGIQYMGPFAAGLMVEAVRYLTGIPLEKRAINWKESKSSRTGLFYAFDIPSPDSSTSVSLAQALFDDLVQAAIRLDMHLDLFQIESTLCIYKNYLRGHRYVGYYLERQRQEIVKSEAAYPEVDLSWIWGWRRKTFKREYLRELDR